MSSTDYKRSSRYQAAYTSPNGGDDFATQLYSYWKLNESPDDAMNNIDLTEIGSPSYVTGLVFPKAIRLVDASGQYLRNNTETSYSPVTVVSSEVFTIHAWVKWTTFDAFEYIFLGGIGTTAASAWAYLLKNNTSNTITGLISDGTNTASATTGAASTGSWLSVFFWHEGDGKARVQLNDDTAVASSATLSGSLFEADKIHLGSSLGVNNLNADLGPVTYWAGRFLDSDERSDYYNGGSGRVIVV